MRITLAARCRSSARGARWSERPIPRTGPGYSSAQQGATITTTVNTTRTPPAPSQTPARAAPRQAGVTLFELVVVMMIIAILAAIGIPTFRYITTSSRMSGEVNALLGDLQYARSEAVREGEPVTVCVAGSTTKPYSCAGTGITTWQNGWIVFTDLSDNQTINTSDPVLRVQDAFTSGDTFQADNDVSSITFNREGFAYTGVSKVTLTLRDASQNVDYTRCLYISESGMMSTTQHSMTASCQ